MKHGQKEFDKKYYRRFFKKYDQNELEKYYRWSDGWIRFLDGYIDIKDGNGKTLLELGASLGYFAKVFKDRGFDVSASDISSYIVKKGGTLQKDIKFFKLDIEKTPKILNKFDYVIAFEILEHLKDPEKAFFNIKKLLKDNGTLIFSTPFPSKRSLSDPTHINVHKESWWLKIGKNAGFKKRKLIHVTFIPYLYRISQFFSWGFPIKTNIPFVNSTCFFIFEK